MTIGLDARFVLHGSVHPHSRLVHLFLRENRRASYPAQVLLFTDRAPDADVFEARYAAPNVAIEVIPAARGRLGRLRWLSGGLPRALRRSGVSVFYSSFYFLPPRCAGIRLVNTIHDCCYFYIDPGLNRGLLASPAYLWILKRFMRWTNRRADRTVTVSHFSKEMLVRHLGIPPDKVLVCYHGLDPVEPRTPAALPASPDSPYFLFVGTNLPKKNIKQCIEGYARLPNEVRSRFVLRLKTSCYPEDRRQVERLGVADRVEFIEGHLGEEAMAGLYRGANLLVLLSYDEGFGLPIIEAFAAGVPVLVSNRAACAELVSLPECRAEPDETEEIAAKWLALASDPDLRARCIAEQGRALWRFEGRRAANAFFASLAP